MIYKNKAPELLAPAGSMRALDAAVAAGADAVYFGAKSFNARAGADNFSDEEITEAIRKLKILGVRSNITMNTQLFGGELKDALLCAEKVLCAGADAIIVADIGLATLIKRYFPEAEIHASTQMCGENVKNAEIFKSLGFSRMVAAREISFENLRFLCENSPIETEIFVHGALCVSHSGSCLMSSVIGGRSGNRGECAQPCRLPYKCGGCEYPLSLKDISLSGHMKEILDTGVASLKIEGRMKSPEYVYGVVSVFRKLIDEKRNATKEETAKLAALFSRTGFTDGYFENKISHFMLGIRTDEDKIAAKTAVLPEKLSKKFKISISAKLRAGEPLSLTGEVIRDGKIYTVAVFGEKVNRAVTSPLSPSRIAENLGKLGNTFFEAEKIDIDAEENINLPISAVNAARRSLCEKLENILAGEKKDNTDISLDFERDNVLFSKSEKKSAYFVYGKNITKRALSFFDEIYLPFDEYIKFSETSGISDAKIGVAFPPVAFDIEIPEIRKKAKKCAELGCEKSLITNLWQINIAKENGFSLAGDLRLNIWNSYSAAFYEEAGFSSIILSPETGTARALHIGAKIPRGTVVYGRLPLMTLEKCVIKEIAGIKGSGFCSYCDTHDFSYLKDRTDAVFPVCREREHRNIVYNSVPVYMLDKASSALFSHFIFTDESEKSVDDVIDAAIMKTPPKGKFKRI